MAADTKITQLLNLTFSPENVLPDSKVMFRLCGIIRAQGAGLESFRKLECEF